MAGKKQRHPLYVLFLLLMLLMLALEQQKEAEPAARMLSVREVFALGAKL